MKKYARPAICLFVAAAMLYIFPVLPTFSSPDDFTADAILRERLRSRIEAAATGLPSFSIGSDIVRTTTALPIFYAQRLYEPVWVSESGPLPQVSGMVRAIREADAEGLNPRDYHIEIIASLYEKVSNERAAGTKMNPGLLIDLEFMLTDAYLLYGSHLVNGRINPETYDPEWKIEYGETNVLEILSAACSDGRFVESLENLKPKHSRYLKLREARLKYQKIADGGGWPAIGEGPPIKAGSSDPRTIHIRERLEIEGYAVPSPPGDTSIYDKPLMETVQEFQRHYGLEPDGVVGPETIGAMNVTARQRTRQIALVMERWRWLPRRLGPKYIRVNIANFKLAVLQDEKSVLDMKVIVGRTYRQTPVFAGKMTYIVLSPYWNVPQNIAVKDKLPLIRKDPGYLTKNSMKVFSGWGADAREIDPWTIDWSNVTAKNFNYWLRQDPGPENALGKVKFMFPNEYNVYLHDTPSRELFDRAVGAFSSGCIRLSKPIELAEFLLQDTGEWDGKKIMEVVDKRIETMVRLKEPIPVYLIYSTVLVNEDGSLDFRNDIYGRDKKLDQAMKEILPDSM